LIYNKLELRTNEDTGDSSYHWEQHILQDNSTVALSC